MELLFGERQAFGCAMDLDDFAARGQDEIGVGLRRRVLGVVEIEDWRALVDAALDLRDLIV